MTDIEHKIYELACLRDTETDKWLYGRRRIMRMVPGTTEWAVRQIIKDARGEGNGAMTAPTPSERGRMVKGEHLANLPKIVVKVPKRKLAKKPQTKNVEHWVIGSDFHAPWEHEEACELFYQITEDINPGKVVLLGDVINLDPMSRYDKIPGTPSWLEDVAASGRILGNVMQAAPDAEWEWYEGNHEIRLKKHLIRHDPIFYGQLTIMDLFTISHNNEAIHNAKQWKYIEQSELFVEDLNLVLAHGHKVRKHSGMSAFTHIDDLLLSVVVGHAHRLGLYRKSSGRSRYLHEQPLFGIETGCLCKYDIPYIEGKTTNWQHGFAVLTIDRSDEKPLIEPTIVEINDGKAIFRGKTYRA
jgi:predicted phosphodiesterase